MIVQTKLHERKFKRLKLHIKGRKASKHWAAFRELCHSEENIHNETHYSTEIMWGSPVPSRLENPSYTLPLSSVWVFCWSARPWGRLCVRCSCVCLHASQFTWEPTVQMYALCFPKYTHINTQTASVTWTHTGQSQAQHWCSNFMPHIYILVLRKLCTRQ